MDALADESVDSGIINGLRRHGLTIFSVAQECPGIKDTDVLDVAVKNNVLLVTEDKDFGELAFRLKLMHRGILLIRLNDLPRNERITIAVNTIIQNLKHLNYNFTVLSKNGLRIKNLSGKAI